jgi:hypothetical protein
MKTKILRREKSGYRLGLVFCFTGLIVIAATLLKMWLHVSGSQLVLSDLWSSLWTVELDFGLGVRCKLIYFTMLGTVLFILGTVMVALSQKWFTLSGETVLLTCPYCKNHWKASRAKAWAECPHCRQFIQPQVARTS